MKKNTFLKWLIPAVLLSALLHAGCGSDRAGDEIGTMSQSRYPETYQARNSEVFAAKDVQGPLDHSQFPAQHITSWKQFENGSDSRLAILLTDTGSSWIGLAHGLKAIGVPFIITDDYHRALTHKVVLVYPVISGAALSRAALGA